MDLALGIMLGLGLAAAVGFRIFVPFLVASLAAHSGHLELTEGFAWIGTTPALVMFAVATLLEIAAYHVPLLDNLLDAVAAPAAAVCGAILVMSTVHELDPLIRWPVAIIAGGGTAGLIRSAGAGVRAGSTVATAGFANPLVTATETFGSAGLAVLAVALPLIAFLLTILLLVFVARRLAGLRRRLRAR